MQIEINSSEMEKHKEKGCIIESKGQKYLIIQGILFVLRDENGEKEIVI